MSPVSDTYTYGSYKIAQERYRQITEEGYSPEHDAEHDQGELIRAAQFYLIQARHELGLMDDPAALLLMRNVWPWDSVPWEPKEYRDPIDILTKAGALVAAEIDRLNGAGKAESV